MERCNGEKQFTLSEMIGIPKKGIIFSDLDGVWLDEEQNFASPNTSYVESLQLARKSGYLIALNSDTGAYTLAVFAQQLGFDPLIIGEGGAVISLPQFEKKEYLTSLSEFFPKFRQKITKELMKSKPQSTIFIGDATLFIKNGTSIPGNTKNAYIINATRECSFGIYTRGIDTTGNMYVDDSKTQETQQFLRNLLEQEQEKDQVVLKRYEHLGSCLIKDPTIAKWQAVSWIINQFPQGLEYYMLGDTIYDSMEPISDRVVSCAVGNATIDFKNIVAKTGGIQAPAELKVAQGADYIIRQIVER